MTNRKQSLLVALAVLPSLLLAGCDSSATSSDLASIVITPSPVRLTLGGVGQLVVTGVYGDGTRTPITTGLTFSVTAPEIATVSTSGVVAALAAGSTTVTASASGKTATATVIVASSDFASIVITPSPVRLTLGGVGQLVVTGVSGDGTQTPITTGLTFSVTAPEIATVSSSGVVAALAAGSTTVTASASGKTATATVIVASTAATLVAIEIIPPSALLSIRGTQQLTVSGTYSDFSTVNVTAASTFVSSAPGVATISPAGLVTAVAAGFTTIVATHTASGKIATATLFVTGSTGPAPTLSSIALTPASVPLVVNGTQQMTVTGTFSDSTTADLTSSSTFALSALSPAGAVTVSAAGLVTGVAVGTATLTATASGKTSAAVAITVTAAPVRTLLSIALTPATVSLAASGTQQMTVTGTYSAAPITADLTSASTFLSSAPGFATVSAAGLVTGVAAGSATITATHTASSKTATSAVTVSAVTTTGGLVFFDGFDAGVTFVGFGGAANAVSVDTVEKNNGRNSLKFVVTGGPAYSGGAFVASVPRNLSAFNALTFWAKASTANALNVTGIGNDATGSQGFSAESLKIPLTGTWTKYIIPIPVPSKVTANAGLFHLAEGNKNYTIWLNDIQYENLGASLVGPPTLNGTNVGWEAGTTTVAVGAPHQIPYAPNTVGFALPVLPNAGKLTNVSFRYFDLTSSAPSVATVSTSGLVTGVTAGTASITATLGGLAVPGQQAITVSGTAAAGPAAPAAAPTVLPANAISLFSSTFTGTAADKSGNVDFWFAPWSGGGGSVTDFTISGTTHVVKKYELRNYIGIEFIGGPASTPPVAPGANEIDIATPGMTHMHMDVWTPDGSHLVIKLQDAGADSVVVNGDPVKLWPVTLTGKNQWISLDLPIGTAENQGAAWTGKNVAQIVISLDTPAAGGTLYLDNLYFYKGAGGGGGGGAGPTVPPAAPTAPVANVISLFSSTYSGTAADKSANVNSYNATCFGPGGSTVADYTIPGTSHVLKQYTIPANTFGIIELIGAVGGTPSPPDSAICHGGLQSTTGSTLIDVTTMTGGLRFDVWSPGGAAKGTNQSVVSADSTNTIAGPGEAAGATQGTNFDSGTIPIAAGQWVTVDFPWSSSGPPGAPAGLNKVALVKFFFLDAGTYYIDNVYFYK